MIMDSFLLAQVALIYGYIRESGLNCPDLMVQVIEEYFLNESHLPFISYVLKEAKGDMMEFGVHSVSVRDLIR